MHSPALKPPLSLSRSWSLRQCSPSSARCRVLHITDSSGNRSHGRVTGELKYGTGGECLWDWCFRGTSLTSANITIALTAGGTPIDLSSMVVSYNDDQGTHWPNMTYGGIGCIGSADTETWCIAQKINNQTTGALLDNNAQMILRHWTANYNNTKCKIHH